MAALREDEQFQQIRRKRKDKNTPWWPALGSVFPEGPFPERADEYRRVVLKSLREAWSAYAPTIDGVVSRV